ncbi:MAG TPA: hypothetical protein ENN96_02415 [Candidatus Acetothermia bacterium]|nr:hypothetical protein [Candidatus Acetothermia bacterium]
MQPHGVGDFLKRVVLNANSLQDALVAIRSNRCALMDLNGAVFDRADPLRSYRMQDDVAREFQEM